MPMLNNQMVSIEDVSPRIQFHLMAMKYVELAAACRSLPTQPSLPRMCQERLADEISASAASFPLGWSTLLLPVW